MKMLSFLQILNIPLGIIILRSAGFPTKGEPRMVDRIVEQNSMSITSKEFISGEMIPKKFTCEGEGVNPQLEISNVPFNAVSLALIVHDGDAPVEGGWTHWVVFNIDPGTNLIAENSVPEGAIQGQTSFGKPGWGGPCPPSGTHHYEFKLYALDSKISLDENANKNDLEHAMEDHIIAQARLIGLYRKEN